MWLGLHDKSSEGAFEWTDGTPVNYTLWSPGQPDDHGGAEDCGHMRKVYGEKWNDAPCGYQPTVYLMCKLPMWWYWDERVLNTVRLRNESWWRYILWYQDITSAIILDQEEKLFY